MFEVSISKDKAIEEDGYLTIEFKDTGVDLDVSNVQCNAIFGFDSSGTQCNLIAENIVKLTGPFPTNDQLLIFTVSNVPNPSFVSNFYVDITSYDSNDDELEVTGSKQFKYTTEPGAITMTMQSAGSDTCGDYTDVDITFSVENTIETGGTLQLEMAKWNQGTQSEDQTISMISYSDDDYSQSFGGYIIDCDSTDFSFITCVFNPEEPDSSEDIATTYDILTVSGFDKVINSGTTYEFTISESRFRNPYSTQPVSSFRVSSLSPDGDIIDYSDLGISYEVDTPYQLDPSVISIQATNPIIYDQSQYDLVIQTPLPLSVGAVMYLTIPSAVSIYSDEAKTDLVLDSAVGYSPLYPIILVSVVDSTNQIIKLSNLVYTSEYYVDVGTSVKISLLDLINPSTVSQSDSFELLVYDQEYISMQITNLPGVSASPGILESLQVEPSNYRTREEVNYYFRFIISNDVASDAKICIEIPDDLIYDATNQELEVYETLSESTSISYDSDSHTLTFESAFDTDYTAPTAISFNINGAFTNPACVKTTEDFVIYTTENDGTKIDQGSVSITAVANDIESVSAKSCTNIDTASQTGDVCDYTLSFTFDGAKYPILTGSYLEITFPDELGLGYRDTIRANSYVDGDTDDEITSQGTFSFDSDNNLIIQGLFDFGDTESEREVDEFEVILASIVSPRTTKETQSFKCRIWTSDGYLQYKKESGIVTSVYEAKPFDITIFKRSNEVNGAYDTEFEFTLQVSLDVYQGEYIKIVVPDDITIQQHPNQCVGLDKIDEFIPCTVKDNNLYLQISLFNQSFSSYEAGDIFQFKVTQIQNPLSLKPSTSFKVYIAENAISEYYINQMTTGLSLLNTWAGNLTNFQILPDSNELATETNYIFYFSNQNMIPEGGYIKIYFPSSVYTYDFNDVEYVALCSGIKNIDSSVYCEVESGHTTTIKVYDAFRLGQLDSGHDIGINIKNILNPSVSVSSQLLSDDVFEISTLDSDGYVIDKTYNVTFNIGCETPCLTCEDDLSKCTSCINNDPSNPLYLYQESCVNECGAGYYEDAETMECKQCQFPCETCSSGETGKCLSCLESSGLPYIYEEQGTCFESCPVGTYLHEKSCKVCEDPCLSCSSSSVCLSCDASMYYFDEYCYAECPDISVPLVTNDQTSNYLECQECESPCSTCQDKVDFCTSCVLTPYPYYLYDNECLEVCPKAYLPDEDNVCVKQSEDTYPFVFSTITAMVLVFIAIGKIIAPSTRFSTASLAISSVLMPFLFVYHIIYLVKDRWLVEASLVVLSLILNTILNIFWYRYYNNKILKNDKHFVMYAQKYPCLNRFVIIVSFVFTFQFFRVQYSRLLGKSYFKCTFYLKEKYYRKMNRYSLFQIAFVYTFCIIAAAYNLRQSWYGRQVFWADLDVLLHCFIMLIIHIYLILRIEFLYGEDKFAITQQMLYDEKTGKLQRDTDFSGFEKSNQETQINLTTQAGGATQRALLSSRELSSRQRKDAFDMLVGQVKYQDELEIMRPDSKEKSLANLFDKHNLKAGDEVLKYDEWNFDKGTDHDDLSNNKHAVGKQYQTALDQNMRGTKYSNRDQYQFHKIHQQHSYFSDDSEDLNNRKFFSNPQNARCALQHDPDLRERHNEFQLEINQRMKDIIDKKQKALNSWNLDESLNNRSISPKGKKGKKGSKKKTKTTPRDGASYSSSDHEGRRGSLDKKKIKKAAQQGISPSDKKGSSSLEKKKRGTIVASSINELGINPSKNKRRSTLIGQGGVKGKSQERSNKQPSGGQVNGKEHYFTNQNKLFTKDQGSKTITPIKKDKSLKSVNKTGTKQFLGGSVPRKSKIMRTSELLGDPTEKALRNKNKMQGLQSRTSSAGKDIDGFVQGDVLDDKEFDSIIIDIEFQKSKYDLKDGEKLTNHLVEDIKSDLKLAQNQNKILLRGHTKLNSVIQSHQGQLKKDNTDCVRLRREIKELEAELRAQQLKLNQAQRSHQREKKFIDRANYTSNEDKMNASPFGRSKYGMGSDRSNGQHQDRQNRFDNSRRINEESKEYTMGKSKGKLKNKNKKNSKPRLKRAIKEEYLDPNKYSAYFQHTMFEKAIITSKGKAVLDNQEVDLIAKGKGMLAMVDGEKDHPQIVNKNSVAIIDKHGSSVKNPSIQQPQQNKNLKDQTVSALVGGQNVDIPVVKRMPNQSKVKYNNQNQLVFDHITESVFHPDNAQSQMSKISKR